MILSPLLISGSLWSWRGSNNPMMVGLGSVSAGDFCGMRIWFRYIPVKLWYAVCTRMYCDIMFGGCNPCFPGGPLASGR